MRFKLDFKWLIFAVFTHQGYMKVKWFCSGSGTHQPPCNISETETKITFHIASWS